MGLVLDSSALIALERCGEDPLTLLALYQEEIVVSAIVRAELLVGLRLASQAHKPTPQQWVNDVHSSFQIVHFTGETAKFYADVFALLRRGGRMIPPNDLQVAATAMALGFGALISPLGEAHLRAIPTLRVEVLTITPPRS